MDGGVIGLALPQPVPTSPFNLLVLRALKEISSRVGEVLYLVAFLAALLIDTIPVFAPPAWTVLTFLIVKYSLNPWLVVVVGCVGSTIGRWILSLYIPHVADRILSKKTNENVRFVGKRLGKSAWASFVFVLFYSLTPLSTTALFTAAGTARVKPLHILPAFFIGKFISDAVMVFTGRYAAPTLSATIHGQLSWKTAIVALLGGGLMAAVFLIDWRKLLEHKRLTAFQGPRWRSA